MYQSAEHRVLRAESVPVCAEYQSAECRVQSVYQCAVCRVQCPVCRVQCVLSAECRVQSLYQSAAVYRVQSASSVAQCTECRVQSIDYRVQSVYQCPECRVQSAECVLVSRV